ncbi:response regulator [Rhodocytophaga aerolata]|uniref:Response regulator n=1 Tax=Rhodocytophaga aerolata TaxID=455078 RepID=A0ABT8RKR7_9BACT|nr:response regulator [Rhodocytophaga aerolata]MDO1451780.1 response regulator [Rhodocytophaga aerolata]
MKQFNKILLVEDQDIDAYLSKTVLQQMGLAQEVILCKDGQQALAYIDQLSEEKLLEADKQADLDLILLDIKMPGMDGFAFLQELRQSYQKHYTVVILSASENATDISQAASFAASYYLVKPLTEDKLHKMISRCFAPLEKRI